MKLYPYQEAYIKDMPKNVIMSADTGLGKGQMSLAHYLKHSAGTPLLVIAPASKVRTEDWNREIAMGVGEDFTDYTVVSYDKFARHPDDYVSGNVALIADECDFIANSQAKRSKAVAKLIRTRCVQFIGLSATPLPNGWSSLENYAIIFGLVRNKTEFITKYVRINRDRGFPIIMGYNNIPEMRNLWNRVARPLDRQGIADLPPSSFIKRGVFLSPMDIGVYQNIIKTKMTPDGEMLDSPSKTFAYLRQWTTKFREDELISLIEGTREHIIVFYNFNVERDLILKVLAKEFKDRTVYEQSGHQSNLPPRDKWRSMKPSVTIAQYQSASVAIELTYASVTIYLSPTYSYAKFYQSMGRTKRNGQTKKTVFYMIAVQNTLDAAVYKVLKTKSDFSIKLMESYLKEVANE